MPGRPLSYLASLPVDLVKGIGPASAKRLGSIGIDSVADLLLHAPRRYLDRSQMYDLADVPLGEQVSVAGTVMEFAKRPIRNRRTLVSATIGDGTGVVEVVWFNPYIKFDVGEEVVLSLSLIHI